jgi:hypothetical protein
MIMTALMPQETNIKSVEDAINEASMFFYRLERMTSSAIVLNEFKDGTFQDALYKQDCLYYQLESIRNIAKQCETFFEDLAFDFGSNIDTKLKALEGGPASEAELLAAYRASSKEDQDFILVSSHFYARKGWSKTMRGYLSKLAKLCVAEAPKRAAPTSELLPENCAKSVLAGGSAIPQD